jgi:hypothetical protein
MQSLNAAMGATGFTASDAILALDRFHRSIRQAQALIGVGHGGPTYPFNDRGSHDPRAPDAGSAHPRGTSTRAAYATRNPAQ